MHVWFLLKSREVGKPTSKMEDLLVAPTRFQMQEFYSVGIEGDGADYYFVMPRPPEEIEGISIRSALWRTLSLCNLALGPPEMDKQRVHFCLVNLPNYIASTNVIATIRAHVSFFRGKA